MARATKPAEGAAKARAAKPAAEPVKVRRTVGKDKTVKITVETPPPTTPAAGPPPGLDDAARLAERVRADLLDAVRELRAAVGEVKAFRDEREALVRELTALRQEVGAARADAAEAVKHLHTVRDEAAGALDRVRAEAAAAVGPVGDLKHLVRETGEQLVREVGGQSVAVAKVVQVREQVEEAVREATKSGERIKGFRAECEAAAKQADILHLKAREAYLQSLAEVLKGLERVKAEAAAARERVAEVTPPEPARASEPVSPTTAADGGNRLGLTVAPGVVIAEVEADSLAADLELVKGDVIEAVNGADVASGPGLRDAIAALSGGGDLSVRVRRGDHSKDIVTRLGEPKDGEAGGRLGATVAAGVVVAEVMPGSPAAAAGVEPGDVVEEANGQEVASGDQLRAVVQALPPDGEAVLSVTRAGESREVVIQLSGESNGARR
ncbi:MAG: PDZ domain-containing protein [Gemmataceae bacterium]|nr:PDZ domain-containing protein [Gemmataceae bacterium]